MDERKGEPGAVGSPEVLFLNLDGPEAETVKHHNVLLVCAKTKDMLEKHASQVVE